MNLCKACILRFVIYAKHGRKFHAIVQALGSNFAVCLAWLCKEHTTASHNELTCGSMQVNQALEDVSLNKLINLSRSDIGLDTTNIDHNL